MSSPFKIGVVGFSRPHFDHKIATSRLREHLNCMLKAWECAPSETELVSGLTNMGVPRLAYQVGQELGMITVGFSAAQAKRVRCGCYPVDKTIIVGKRFGDESQDFVGYIDTLIRAGGGPQSRHEVSLFCERFQREEQPRRLIESELAWLGR